MYVLCKHLHVFDGRRWQNPVTEVKDMPGAAADTSKDIVGAAEHPIRRSEQ
jgi:hypothetical protein